MEGTVSTLEGTVSALEADLADSKATASALETDLETANNGLKAANSKVSKLQADVSTQRTLNSALSEELKTVKDPRHFGTITELVDWLQKDDTDTVYANKDPLQLSLILSIRALRDGYILPVNLYKEDGRYKVHCKAIIDDETYTIRASDDSVRIWRTGTSLIPSHPLPLD